MATKPFDFSNEGADIIIHTSDECYLYTHKVLLSRSSTFFREMLSGSEPELTVDGLPVWPAQESSWIWKALLSWIDPSISTPPTDINTISMLVEPVDKYLMDGIRGRLCTFLGAQQADYENGLKMWAVTVRLGDNELAKRLARYATIARDSYLPIGNRRVQGWDWACTFTEKDLDGVSALALMRLDGYRCQIATSAAGVFGRKDRGGEVYSAIQSAQAYTINDSNSYGSKHDEECRATKIGSKKSLSYRDWFLKYLNELQERVRERPCKDTLIYGLNGCFDPLKNAMKCSVCREDIVESIVRFNAEMGDKVECAVGKVEVPEFV